MLLYMPYWAFICFHLIKYNIHIQIHTYNINPLYVFHRSTAIMRERNQSLNLIKYDNFVVFKYLM